MNDKSRKTLINKKPSNMTLEKGNRPGFYISQSTGYSAFIPANLPPTPTLTLDKELLLNLATASTALGRLDGLASLIKDPDLFVYLYVRKEALLSAQIEGTQCSLEDILDESAIETSGKKINPDIQEVSNYVQAINTGLKHLDKIPVSSRLIKELHALIVKGVRGANKTPGEYRQSQNWIGQHGATLMTAEYVPPPAHEVNRLMGELEKFIHNDDSLPPLVKAALVHYQFETIHPFLDGNGRVGRLLITLLLCSWGLLQKPLLYLSYFFKANRTEYYSKLSKVRSKGDFEGWINFFLTGVSETAGIACSTAKAIHDLHIKDQEKLNKNNVTATTFQVFEQLCRFPIVTVPQLVSLVDGTTPKIQRAVDSLKNLGVVKEITGQQRNRRWVYAQYMELLRRDTVAPIG